MKSRLQAVQKESKDLRNKIQDTEAKMKTTNKSRNEYFDLVRNMVESNTNLKAKIEECDRRAEKLSVEARTTEAHQKMVQLALEAKLDEALAERARVEASTVRAYQMLAQHVEDIAEALEQASASIVRGGPSRDPFSAGVAKELKTLRDGARTMLMDGAPGFAGDPDHVEPVPHAYSPPPRSLGFQSPPGGANGFSGMNGHGTTSLPPPPDGMNGGSRMNGYGDSHYQVQDPLSYPTIGVNGHSRLNGTNGVNGHSRPNGTNGFSNQQMRDDEFEDDDSLLEYDLPNVE